MQWVRAPGTISTCATGLPGRAFNKSLLFPALCLCLSSTLKNTPTHTVPKQNTFTDRKPDRNVSDPHTSTSPCWSRDRNSHRHTDLGGRAPGGRSGGPCPERGRSRSPSPAGSTACCQQTSGAARGCADAPPSSPGWHGAGPAWPLGPLPAQSPGRQAQLCSGTRLALPEPSDTPQQLEGHSTPISISIGIPRIHFSEAVAGFSFLKFSSRICGRCFHLR